MSPLPQSKMDSDSVNIMKEKDSEVKVHVKDKVQCIEDQAGQREVKISDI